MARTPEEQAAIDAQRARIATTSFKKEEEVKENDKDNDTKGEDTDDKGSEKVADEGNEESKEADGESGAETEKKIETSEEKQEDLETEKAAAKSTAEKARIQRKIDKEVAKRKTLEDEVTALKAQLAAKEGDGDKFTAEDVKKEAKRIADETISERDFVNASNRLADAAEKIDKDFMKKVKEIAVDVAPIPGHMIGILDDLKKKNGGQVLSYLVDNPDEYEDYVSMSPLKATAKLVELSIELAAKTAPKKKELSKVPPPNEPLGGKGGNVSDLVLPKEPTKNMDQFIRTRNAQIEQRRKEKAAGYR